MSDWITSREQESPRPGQRDVTREVARLLPGVEGHPGAEALHALMAARVRRGVETYGQTLQTYTGRDVARDLDEELADALQYVTQAIMEGVVPTDRTLLLWHTLAERVRVWQTHGARAGLALESRQGLSREGVEGWMARALGGGSGKEGQ